MYKLPPHPDKHRDELISVLRNRKETHEYPSIVPENMEEKIAKISFICGCHGSSIASLNVYEPEIPKNGKYKETKTGPIMSDLFYFKAHTEDVPTYNNKVLYKATLDEYEDEELTIAEFEYSTIDVRKMNVTLSTTNTCFGIPVYREGNSYKSYIYKQELVNDIMEDVFSTCPKNTIYKKFHKTYDISHIEYDSRRIESAARKIQEFVKHKKQSTRRESALRRESAARKIQDVTRRKRTTPKKVFMNYEKEKVSWLMNKKFTTETQLVAVIEEPIPLVGDVDIEPTDSDAHKLVMIITKYTASGCRSTKYVLLASDIEMEYDKDKLYDEFPKAVEFLRGTLEEIPGDLILGRKHGYPVLTTTLHDLLRLGKLIIEECNGRGSSRTTPIDIYDLSCNSFGHFSEKMELNEIESSQIKMMDKYLRGKNIAYGGNHNK